MNRDQHGRLRELLSQPTAPFRETHVIRHVAALLDRGEVPFFEDPLGNLVLGAGSLREYRRLLRARTAEPLRLFIAHMDHPGFHGLRWVAPDRLQVRWHGGSPVKHVNGARVCLVSDLGIEGTGRIARATMDAAGRAIATAEVRVLDGIAGRPRAPALFGSFEFRSPVWQQGGRLYCPAADDLVGVFAIVETARLLSRTGRGRDADGKPFIGLLTRAEEVGFVGAVGHLELGWLQQRRRPLMAISLEASRTLPGAVIGKGPVVRLGDRRTVFHPDGLRLLTLLAEKALKGAHQRRIMDGGSCEATAMTAWGIPAIGISVPLGNYHNQGFEGGPGCIAPEGPAPEFVSLEDVGGLLRLCRALMTNELPWEDPWAAQRTALRKNLAALKKLL